MSRCPSHAAFINSVPVTFTESASVWCAQAIAILGSAFCNRRQYTSYHFHLGLRTDCVIAQTETSMLIPGGEGVGKPMPKMI